ncbi:MAG: hypothetical protein H7Z37_13750 [Pyrinomonadaceae bacterium]|nr:hypothetical protein [Pyrinomonadaceae bacterium]
MQNPKASNNKIQNPKSKIQNGNVSPARLAAFEILSEIESNGAFTSILLPRYEENLAPNDRALCHEITLGVLRNEMFLDALISHFSGKPIAKLDSAVKIALRIALYQIRFLSKIPESAAVNESVNLIYHAKLRSAVPFVNAILRRSLRERDFDVLANITNPLEKLSIETSHPVWLLEKWTKQFGFEETSKLAQTNNFAPTTAFRLTNDADDSTLQLLIENGAKLEKSDFVETAWRVKGASQTLRELVEGGKIYIQDEASQLVASQAVQSPKSKVQSPNEIQNSSSSETFNSQLSTFNFLEVCAAPGSKLSQIVNRLAALDLGLGTLDLLCAGDFTIPRIKILRETLNKFGGESVNVLRYDAEKSLPFADETFDCVLLDAPCSGTGTIRHNPEIRYLLQTNDFAELSEKQFRILTNAAKTVKRGGRLIYSTCSLEIEENENVITKFLATNPDFEQTPLDLSPELLIDSGAARTFPPRDDVDGFFIAQLTRKS